MKKIALFSLLMCCGMVSYCFAAEDNTDMSEICRKHLKEGTKVQGHCKLPDKPTETDEKVLISPKTEGINAFINKPCDSAPRGVKDDNHRCFLNLVTTSPETYQISCAAKVCDKDHLLWFDAVKGSQGVCFARSWLQSFCSQGCGCKDGKVCVLNEVVKYAPGEGGKGLWPIPTQAFVGQSACHCVKESNDTQPCRYRFTATIKCNGKTMEKIDYVDIPRDVIKDENCKTEKDGGTFTGQTLEQWIKGKLPQIDEEVKKFCDKIAEIGGGNGDSMNLTSATNTLDAFLKKSSEEGDVWKTADGKFNGVRLASDLTAGVVLGTVGGVVSGVVITKKQKEKGFEALNCAVGGQKIAGWGDTFSVGLQK